MNTKVYTLLIALTLCFFASEALYAQKDRNLPSVSSRGRNTPSVPSRHRNIPSIPNRSSQTTGAVYGTQYDWLSTRYATYNDIRYMDKGQIRVLRNSIYARHGRKFKDANLRAYFRTQSWYTPRYDEIPASRLNNYEKTNIQFLKSHE